MFRSYTTIFREYLKCFLKVAKSIYYLLWRHICKKSVNTHYRLKYFLTNKIFLLEVMYRYVRTYDFRCKTFNSNMFFHCLCSSLMEKHDFYCSVIP